MEGTLSVKTIEIAAAAITTPITLMMTASGVSQ